MAEKLSPGWTRVKFGDIVENVNDFVDRATLGEERYLAGEHIDEGELRVRRWGLTSDSLFPPTFKRRFLAGDVLLHSRNIRKIAQPDFPGVTGEKLFVLRVKRPDLILPELLPFALHTGHFNEYVTRMWAGSTNKFLNQTPLMRYEIALPPLTTQHRMAAMLSAQRTLRETSQDVAEAAHMSLRAFEKATFIEAPDGKKVTVGDVADVRTGSTPSRSRADYWAGSVPWLPTGKVNERRISIADEFVTDLALAETSICMIPAGSTLIAMIGEGHTRGRAARMEIDACINQNFAAVTPAELVEPLFLFFQLEAQYEALRNWSQGTNQQALNASLVRSFPFYLPPRERQRELCRALSTLESAWERATTRAEEARTVLSTAIGRTVEAM